MYKEIKIGKTMIPMIANAATALRYKNVFGKDLLAEFQNTGDDATKPMISIPELAFIMAKAAEAREGKADMNRLNEEIYLDWLEQFDPMDIPLAAEQIITLYAGDAMAEIEPKKNRKGKAKEN